MGGFSKYPSTPHLIWLGEHELRGDKILTNAQATQFLTNDIVVEEKVDGSNVGISFSNDGVLQLQARGQYIDFDEPRQFSGIHRHIHQFEDALFDALGTNLILFGEWCYYVHSLNYDRLPDWFLGFDVYDKSSKEFWSSGKRNRLLFQVGLPSVARIARGLLSEKELILLLDHQSQYGMTKIEGLYLRCESGQVTKDRAKIVRPEFQQGILEHWMRGPMATNTVVPIDKR